MHFLAIFDSILQQEYPKRLLKIAFHRNQEASVTIRQTKTLHSWH